MSLIFATQLTAVATVALVVLALAAAIVAGIALSKQARELAILAEQNDRDIDERHHAQAARVFTGVQDARPRYAHPYAKNGSDFPVYDVQLWQAGPDGLSDHDGVRMIPPGGVARNGRHISYQDALENTVLTFPGRGRRTLDTHAGQPTLKEQEHDTARDSILAAFGGPLSVPADPAAAAAEAGQPEEPRASGTQ